MSSSDPLRDALDWQRRLAEANATAAGLDDVRAINDRFMKERAGELASDVSVESVSADGVPAEWVTAGDQTSGPVVIFLHGGGFMLGAAAENRTWTSSLARSIGGRVFGADYRLAPENAHPAQVDDACAAYRWLLKQGTPADEIVFLGESAGGGLVLAALLALKEAGDTMPAAAVLTSPLVDFTLSSPSLDLNAATDTFVNREILQMMLDALLQGQDAASVSPLQHDLGGLPPLLIQVGSGEAIFDDSARLAEAAESFGVDVEMEVWDDMIHLWHGFPDLPQAAEATARIADFVLTTTGTASTGEGVR